MLSDKRILLKIFALNINVILDYLIYQKSTLTPGCLINAYPIHFPFPVAQWRICSFLHIPTLFVEAWKRKQIKHWRKKMWHWRIFSNRFRYGDWYNNYYNKRYNCMSNITSRIIDSITRITSITSAANIVFSVPKLDTEAGFGKKNNHTQYYKCRITYNCGSCCSSSNY